MINRKKMRTLSGRETERKLSPVRKTLRRLEMTVSQLRTAVDSENFKQVKYYGFEIADDAKNLVQGVRGLGVKD